MSMPRIPIFIVLLLASVPALSATAQTQMTPATRAKAQAVARDCRADIKSLCAGVQPGEGRIAACLRDNQDKLSPQCGTALSDFVTQ